MSYKSLQGAMAPLLPWICLTIRTNFSFKKVHNLHFFVMFFYRKIKVIFKKNGIETIQTEAIFSFIGPTAKTN